MRYSYTVVLLFLTSSILFSGNKPYNYFTRWSFTVDEQQFQRIKEQKVEIRERFSAFYKGDGSLPDELTFVEELAFDRNGNLYEKLILDASGGIRSKYNFVYDENNNLLSEELSNRNGNVLHRREIKYTENNDTLEVNFLSQRNLRNYRKVFNYNDDNQLISKLYYDSKDELFLKEEFTYLGNHLSVLEIYLRNALHDRIEFYYNEKGNIVKEIENGIEKNYYYDEKDRLVKVESIKMKRFYEYDENDNIIDEQFYIENDQRQFRITFSYYENGLLNELIRYDATDTKIFYTKFEYIFFD